MKTIESIYEEYQKKRMEAFWEEETYFSFMVQGKKTWPYYEELFLEAHHEFKLNDTMCKIMEKHLL